jgi:hypothetical protein
VNTMNVIKPVITHSYVAIHIDQVNRYAGHLDKFTIPAVETGNSKWATRPVILYRRVSMMCLETNQKEIFVLFPRHCAKELHDCLILQEPKFVIRPMPTMNPDYNFPAPNPEFSLYPLQQEIIKVAMDECLTIQNRDFGKASCIIQSETGTGKSFIAIGILQQIIERHGPIRVLWVVLNTMLQEQVERDLRRVYSIVVSTNVNKIDQFNQANVCIIIINSVMKLPKSSYDSFGLVIYDEIPNYCSETRRDVFWLTKGSYTIGLTAEISARSDKLDKVYLSHLGPVVYGDELENHLIECGDISERIEFIVFYKFEPYWTPNKFRNPSISKHGTREFLPTIKKCLVDDADRNNKLINGALLLRDIGHAVLLIVHHREHVLDLVCRMKEAMKTHHNSEIRMSTTYRMMGGDGLGLAVNAACAEFTTYGSTGPPMMYIATYGYASFGLSLNHLTALILGVPPHGVRKRQIVGRILRLNKEFPHRDKVPRIIWGLFDHMQYINQHWLDVQRYLIYRGFRQINDLNRV